MPNTYRTFDRRVQIVVQGSRAETIEASLRVAITSIRAELDALRGIIQKIQETDSGDYDNEGNADAGMNRSPIDIELTNRSGAGRNAGDVVTLDTGNAESFTTTTTANDEGVIGVVSSDSADGAADAIANAAAGFVRVAGIADCKVDADVAAISVGDLLTAHTTAGRARKARSVFDPGIFARALEQKLSGLSTIGVELDPTLRSHNFKDLQPGDERVGYDLDGSITGFSGFLTSTAAWRSTMLSTYIEHQVFVYSANGLLLSTALSYYNVNGGGRETMHLIIDYQDERITKIIRELS